MLPPPNLPHKRLVHVGVGGGGEGRVHVKGAATGWWAWQLCGKEAGGWTELVFVGCLSFQAL